MSDNRKYYYLKLKENFYNSETMVILESMQDGLLYSNLLLKMYPHVTQKRRYPHAQRPSAPHAPRPSPPLPAIRWGRWNGP